MERKRDGRILLRVSGVLMLLCALPMAAFSLNMVYMVSPYGLPGDPVSVVGCLVIAGGYVFSIVTALGGLILGGRPRRAVWNLALAIPAAAAAVVGGILVNVLSALLLPPMALTLVLYGLGVRKSRRAAAPPKAHAKGG